MEKKNKLTVTRGERGRGRGITGEDKGRVKSRSMYKGSMDKDTGVAGRTDSGRWGWVGQGRVMGENGDICN